MRLCAFIGLQILIFTAVGLQIRPSDQGLRSPVGEKSNKNLIKNRIKMKTIKMQKIAKAIKVAYGVNDNEALELVPMFMNLRKAA